MNWSRYALAQLNVTPLSIGTAKVTLIGEIRNNYVLRFVVMAILAFSVLLIFLHILGGLLSRAKVAPFEELWDKGLMRLDVEGSLFEYYEYALMLVSGLAFLYSWKVRREPVFLILAVVDTLLLADNALQLHERGGCFLSGWVSEQYRGVARFTPSCSWRSASAEVAMFVAIAAVSLLLIIPALRKSGKQPVSWCLIAIGCLAGAAVCAVVIDFLHVTWRGSIYGDHFLALAEDGGEMIFMSIHTIISLAIAVHLASQFQRH